MTTWTTTKRSTNWAITTICCVFGVRTQLTILMRDSSFPLSHAVCSSIRTRTQTPKSVVSCAIHYTIELIVTRAGFEPTLNAPKTFVLPLHHRAILWTCLDSNQGPTHYECGALTNWATGPNNLPYECFIPIRATAIKCVTFIHRPSHGFTAWGKFCGSGRTRTSEL